MADRTWNAIDCDGYSKPWSKCARRIWVHIQMIQPNQYGIFISPLGVVKDHWEDVYSNEQIDQALEELIAVGVIRTYRNGQVMWVVEKFARELQGCNTKRQLAGLNNHLDRYPEVKEDFLKEYEVYGEKIEWALNELAEESARNQQRDAKERASDSIEPPKTSQPVTKEQLITDPDPDSDSDSEFKTTLLGGVPPGRELDSPPPDASETELAILRILLDLKGWEKKPSYADLLEYIRQLKMKFPGVDILDETEKLATWLAEKRGKRPSKLRLRNWIECAFKRNPQPRQPEPQERRKLRDGIKLEYGDIDQL